MKTDFEVINGRHPRSVIGSISIIGVEPHHNPYLSVSVQNGYTEINGFLKDEDLERLAVNILKALKSERLNPNT